MNNYVSRLIIKFIDFWKKHKNKIFIVVIIWLIIIVINNILKNRPEEIPEPFTSYTPHISVMNSEEEVPKKYQEPIENLVEKYFNYCNNGQYEEAYNLLTDGCKKNNYPTLESFTGYINEIFEGKKKIYNIQSYSIVDNKYIYNMRILDDILANGTTDGYYYYEEKIVLLEENGEMKLSIAEFVEEQQPNIIIEDDYMIVKVLKKVVDYETETYTIEIDNKTDNYLVIADGSQNNEISMNYDGTLKSPQNQINFLYVNPNAFRVQELVFNNFYDTGNPATSLKLGAVRVLREYDPSVKTTQENLDNAVKLYSVEIPIGE